MIALKRKIDNLGRLVLPNDFREALGIKAGDMLLITSEGDSITIRLQTRVCPLCHSATEGRICTKCAEEIKNTY